MKVQLVDDHPLVRNSIASLLVTNNIKVAGGATRLGDRLTEKRR